MVKLPVLATSPVMVPAKVTVAELSSAPETVPPFTSSVAVSSLTRDVAPSVAPLPTVTVLSVPVLVSVVIPVRSSFTVSVPPSSLSKSPAIVLSPSTVKTPVLATFPVIVPAKVTVAELSSAPETVPPFTSSVAVSSLRTPFVADRVPSIPTVMVDPDVFTTSSLAETVASVPIVTDAPSALVSVPATVSSVSSASWIRALPPVDVRSSSASTVGSAFVSVVRSKVPVLVIISPPLELVSLLSVALPSNLSSPLFSMAPAS